MSADEYTECSYKSSNVELMQLRELLCLTFPGFSGQSVDFIGGLKSAIQLN
jgi:hypothetical protein